MSGAAAALSFAAFGAQAQEIRPANPAEKGDGTMSPAAAAARRYGPLPFSGADVAAKAAANRARDKAEKSSPRRPFNPAGLGPAGGAAAGPSAPVVVGGVNVPGLGPSFSSPPDTTGAIGPTRFVQLVNTTAGIFNRMTGALIGSGTLDQLAGIAASVNSFDVQVIWDPATNRFYYTMVSVFSASDNRLSVGFSTTPDPNNVTTDWCHYTVPAGALFPDFPKLGDDNDFIIIGVNGFQPNFIGSDLLAFSKPPAGTTCPAASTFKAGTKINLVDSSNNQVFTPVPANQIDTSATGFVVARNGALPSTNLWFFNVTNVGGFPVFGAARGVTVGAYTVPPNATQPARVTQVVDTFDSRNTQAVQATDPRTGTFSFWTQHTILDASGTVSAVRAYEIDPVPATPVVLRSGDIASPGLFLFNAAISPDRRHDGAISAFGNSVVIQFNVSGSGTNPEIVAGSSVNGGPLSFLLVMNGAGPYRDFTCVAPGSTCRWGDYSAATPDPRPVIAGRGVVWGTNQFSGVVSPPPGGVNWRTQIFALEP
ncbi:MAG: hypothetical protein M3178_05555 [Pseudomonadota bacterium]|nr:hypothetical protein [Pseudomonadota bacterium]